jgi:hypothetical protein
MYLRETKRRRTDGGEVRYLQLAHNARDPETGRSQAQVIYNFGRADQLDRDALARLVRSISRELDAPDQVALEAGVDMMPVDARDLGGVWVLEVLWQRLGAAAAIGRVAAGRRVEVEAVERVLFALVANWALAPSSKLDGCRWVADEVYLDGVAGMDHTACYRAMTFFLDALAELQETVFFAVAYLLSLDVDVLFFDTTSTYLETDADGDLRRYGHSKDRRADLPQVVGMAVTRGGIPVRVWAWPGYTEDHTVIDQVKGDWPAGSSTGRCGSATRASTRLRTGTPCSAAGRATSSPRSYAQATPRRAWRARAPGAITTSTAAWRSKTSGSVRARPPSGSASPATPTRPPVTPPCAASSSPGSRLPSPAATSSPPTTAASSPGRLRAPPGYRRFLRTTSGGKLRLDRTAVPRDAHYDGKYLLRTSDPTLSAADVARGYKILWEVERGWKDLKHIFGLRPIHHQLAQRTGLPPCSRTPPE